jgi:hypothetical protein
MNVHSRRLLAAGAAAVVSAATCWAAFPVSAAIAVPEVAPYFETSGPHKTNLSTAVTSHGLKSFTAAFVLGKGCPGPATTKLVTAYSSVINKFGVTKVDFDIEGAAISDTATND